MLCIVLFLRIPRIDLGLESVGLGLLRLCGSGRISGSDLLLRARNAELLGLDVERLCRVRRAKRHSASALCVPDNANLAAGHLFVNDAVLRELAH
jgi:hypothetical protein